ncbi:MAG: histidinol dehydrogenase, partial [Ruminococcaceae bacterium]|nr:histidinol dehydrogenase [Oscillospiraceae bacterium]
MKVRVLKDMTAAEKEFVMKRAEQDISRQMELAKEVAADIKENGDEAVLKYTAKFDGVTLTKDAIKIRPEEIEAGYARLDEKTRDAITYAAKNIRNFHEKQMPEELWFTNV